MIWTGLCRSAANRSCIIWAPVLRGSGRWRLAQDVLALRASAGLYTHLDGPHARVPVGQFKIGRIAQSRQPLLTNDVATDPNISDPEWAKREGMVAFAGYPLLADGRTVGVLAMFSQKALSPAILGDLLPLADTLALCIERKRAELALRDVTARAEAERAGRRRTRPNAFACWRKSSHFRSGPRGLNGGAGFCQSGMRPILRHERS